MFPRKQIKANARAALSANYWPLVGYPFLLGLLLMVVLSVLTSNSVRQMRDIASAESIFSAQRVVEQNLAATFTADTITILLSIFVINVIGVGEVFFFYKFYSGSKGDFGTFFDGFKNGQYLHIVGGMFLMTLYVCLWTMLFAIPGAILFGIGFGIVMFSEAGAFLIILGLILYIAGIVMAFVKAYQYVMIPYLLIDRPEFTVKDCFKMTNQMTKGNKWSLFVLDLSFIGWGILSIFTLFILYIFYVGPYANLARAGAYDYLKRIHMPEPAEGPVFQSASFESDYTSVAQPTDNTVNLNNTENDDIFDE